MGYNKDLPREEQLKIVLKNYDKKQAECEALKAECSKLQTEKEQLEKQLTQSKAVYKNMLARFEGQQEKSKPANGVDWEDKYNQLNKKYEKKNKKYLELDRRFKILNGCFGNVVGYVSKAYNQMTAVKTKMAYDLEAMTYEDDMEDTHDTEPGKHLGIDTEEIDAPPATFTEWQQRSFIKYVRSIYKNFIKTGSLRGISTIAKDFGVSALTKEQFFQYGLNTEHLTNDYIINVYNQIKKR